MRKGDVPVNYIVAILLGIAVIGLIGYWIYTTYIKGKGASDTVECLGYRIAVCTGVTSADDEKAKQACPNGLLVKGSPKCDELLQKK